MAVQLGLCRAWSETPKTGFLTTRLICVEPLQDKLVLAPKVIFITDRSIALLLIGFSMLLVLVSVSVMFSPSMCLDDI